MNAKNYNKPQKTVYGYKFPINRRTQQAWLKNHEGDSIDRFLNGITNKYNKEDEGIWLINTSKSGISKDNLALAVEIIEDDVDKATQYVNTFFPIINVQIENL